MSEPETTEATQRRRQGNKGYRRLTINISAEQCEKLDDLAIRDHHGNRSMAAEAAFKLLFDADEGAIA